MARLAPLLHSHMSNKLAKSLLLFGNFVRFDCFRSTSKLACVKYDYVPTPLQNVNGQSLRRNQKNSCLHFKQVFITEFDLLLQDFSISYI